jgi:ribonucleoside-diphosphate reductase subunit M2
MSEYIEFVADRLLYNLGVDMYYNTKNPFDFMENMSLEGKANCFDKGEAQYQKCYVGIENANDEFRTDADF